MELKLQQAIVATKAGRTNVAQSLLTQLIREKPQDANAWFLLGHIVQEPERQVRYLQKTLELEPDHVVAKRRLEQLQNGPIPPPLFPQQEDAGDQFTSSEEGILSSQSAVESANETATVAELSEEMHDGEDTQIETYADTDRTWTEAAGQPLREKKSAREQDSAVDTSNTSRSSSAETETEGTAGEVWLVRILVIMVIVAAIVLGILVLMILI